MTEILHINRSIRNILIVSLGIVLIAVLRELSELLLPLVLAGILALLCIPLVDRLRNFGVPKIIILMVVALVVSGVLLVVINIFITTLSSILHDIDGLTIQFNKKIEFLTKWADGVFKLPFDASANGYSAWFWEWLGALQWTSTLRSVAVGLGDFGKDFLLFFLYFLFLLGGLSDYKQYLDYVVGNNPELMEHVETLQSSISSYIAIKSVISLITGVLATLICFVFGLNYALFWGFLAFLFNFIPSIGSILSTALPMLMAFIQFDGVGRFVGLAAVLLMNQLIIGNVIDPKVMGDKMRLNSITVIFGLVFWGYIWGIPGMLLSVPLNVMVKLILEQSESLSIAARVMGGFDSRTSTPSGGEEPEEG